MTGGLLLDGLLPVIMWSVAVRDMPSYCVTRRLIKE